MAQFLKRQRKPTLPPLTRKNGIPLLRHDPGKLPPGSELILTSPSRRPSLPPSRTKRATTVQHGTEIYLYHNIHTNQVLYSLSRHLRPNPSLSQLAYFGKKTRPPALRKDLWLPFCRASFPNPRAGNEAYKRLMEYKRLHETSYDVESIRETEGPRRGQLFAKKKRAKKLMDQKGNAVADLADVLRQWASPPSLLRREISEEMAPRKVEQIKMRKERLLKKNKERLERWRKVWETQGEAAAGPRPTDWANEGRGLEGVELRWADLRDAEFVDSWPAEVVHDTLQRSRYTAAWPAKPLREEGKVVEEPVEGKEGKEPLFKDEEAAKKPWYRRLL